MSVPTHQITPEGLMVPITGAISLRDFFAGLALCGWAAGRNQVMDGSRIEHVAKSCYRYADAMLEERAK